MSLFFWFSSCLEPVRMLSFLLMVLSLPDIRWRKLAQYFQWPAASVAFFLYVSAWRILSSCLEHLDPFCHFRGQCWRSFRLLQISSFLYPVRTCIRHSPFCFSPYSTVPVIGASGHPVRTLFIQLPKFIIIIVFWYNTTLKNRFNPTLNLPFC